jgi:hypothetical protein
VSADLDVDYPEWHGERARLERRAVDDRWCAEPAGKRGDRDDVEFVDQARPQEGAVEPSSRRRDHALRAQLKLELSLTLSGILIAAA